jgi:hypothetical protein
MKSCLGLKAFIIISWTIGLSGQASAQPPGNPVSASDRFSRLHATSNEAAFVNPKVGQVVHAGETIHIDATVDSGIVPVKALVINSRLGWSQQIGLFGAIVGRKDYELVTTTVDVEESDLPLSLFTAGGFVYQTNNHRARANFSEVGQQQSIWVQAKFPNGPELDVSGSTYLSVSSENPKKVAAARATDNRIYINWIGAGQTRLAVT